MPTVPCPVHVNCPGAGNLDYDGPLSNFSSEAPDVDLFIGVNTGWNQNLPPIGSTWSAVGCLSICESSVSQADADLCAARQEISCTVGGGNPGDNGPLTPPWLHPNGTPIPLFPNLDQSCSFTCPDGLLFTWTVAAGQVLDPNPVVANQIAFSIACRQANLHYMCLGSIGTGCLNSPYSTTISVTQGPGVLPPLSFAIISGSLPSGLVQASSQTQFFISGTPTQAGNFAFTLRVTDANGNFMQKQYILQILGITNINSLPNAMENTPYNVQLAGVGGTAPFTYVLVSGTPPGITLSPSGLFSGTPNYVTAGSYPITVQITDANGLHCTLNGTIKVTLRPGPDWTKLVWSQYVTNQSGVSTATGVAIQNIASGQLNRVGADTCNITPAAAAGVTYAGPQVTSRIILTLSTNCGCQVLDPENTFAARIFQDGFQIGGNPNHPCLNGTYTSGVYTIDFIVSATAGSVFTIDDASPGNKWAQLFNSVPANLSFTWAIVNV